MQHCGLCRGETKKFAKSHLFPKSLARELAVDGLPAKLSTAPSSRPLRSPNGIYMHVVCSRCEADSQQADDALVHFSREIRAKATAIGKGEPALLESDVDSRLLQRACLQMLARAHLSNLDEMAGVALRVDIFERVRRALLGGVGASFGAPIQVCPVHVLGPLGDSVFSPVPADHQGRPLLTFYVPGLCFYVSNGLFRLPYAFRQTRLRLGERVTVASLHIGPMETGLMQRAVESCGGFEKVDAYFDSPAARANAQKPTSSS